MHFFTPVPRFLGDRKTQESQPLPNHNRFQGCLPVSRQNWQAEWRQKLTHHITVPLEMQKPRLLLSQSCRQAPSKTSGLQTLFSIVYGFNKQLSSALLPSLSFNVFNISFPTLRSSPINSQCLPLFFPFFQQPSFFPFLAFPLYLPSPILSPQLLPPALQHICF